MHCPACQRAIPDDARFCIFCAAPVAPAEPEPRAATGPTRRLDPASPYRLPEAAPTEAAAPAATISRRASGLPSGSALFLIGLFVLLATGWIWPWILALIGLSGFANETARGRRHAAWQSLIFFGGLALLFAVNWFWPGILLWLGLMALIKPSQGWRGC